MPNGISDLGFLIGYLRILICTKAFGRSRSIYSNSHTWHVHQLFTEADSVSKICKSRSDVTWVANNPPPNIRKSRQGCNLISNAKSASRQPIPTPPRATSTAPHSKPRPAGSSPDHERECSFAMNPGRDRFARPG